MAALREILSREHVSLRNRKGYFHDRTAFEDHHPRPLALQQGLLAEAAFVQALDETERTAIGKPKFWSAKDHLAHMTFCLHQNLILKMTAILQQQEVMHQQSHCLGGASLGERVVPLQTGQLLRAAEAARESCRSFT